jgi:methyltransferase (TIGR00027 family)
MQTARPSRTALRVALRRAAHQVYDPPPRVLDDPIAVPILGPQYAEEIHKTANKLERIYSVSMRAFVVARSRYAEDALAHAVQHHNATQYVLLGAGLDTFAHRNPHPALRVFEIDHPATQAWKLDLLARSALAIPPTLTHVPVDFEHQDLAHRLAESGFDPTRPTVFAMLGVVPYLTLEAFRSTLRLIAAQPPGSAVVFDYSQPRAVLPPREQLALDSLAARVALIGEPFRIFFTPAEVAAELHRFARIEDLGAPELNARYYANRTDHLRVRGAAGRLLSAWL